MSLNSTDTKEIRKFGLVALIFFGFLCVLGVWLKKPVPTYLGGVLSMLGLGFILAPAPLRPVYSTWLKVAHLIGKVVTTTILLLAYYLVITPSGIIKRFIGGPPLPVKPDKKALSYWVPRSEPVQSKGRFLKRY